MNGLLQNLTPQEYQNRHFPEIMENAKKYDARVKSFLAQANSGRPSSQQLIAFDQELKQWETYFRRFLPAAEVLKQANLPAMHNWIDWAINDMPGLQRVIEGWAQQAAKAEGDATAYAAQKNQEIWEIMKSVNSARQTSFDKINDQWDTYLKK